MEDVPEGADEPLEEEPDEEPDEPEDPVEEEPLDEEPLDDAPLPESDEDDAAPLEDSFAGEAVVDAPFERESVR